MLYGAAECAWIGLSVWNWETGIYYSLIPRIGLIHLRVSVVRLTDHPRRLLRCGLLNGIVGIGRASKVENG